MKKILSIVALVSIMLFTFSAIAAEKVVVIPLNIAAAAASSDPKISYITFNGPNLGGSATDYYALKMQGSGTILSVQTYAVITTDSTADVTKNGTSVTTSPVAFGVKTVGKGVMKTNGTEDFVQDDILSFSSTINSGSLSYWTITVIVQYD